MRAEKVVTALLKADAGLMTMIGSRLYATHAPQTDNFPLLVYEKVSGFEMPPISASLGENLHQSRIQLTAHARTYAEVKDVLESVYQILKYRSGTIAGVRVVSVLPDTEGPDDYDGELLVYSQARDYLVTHYQ